MMLLVLLVLPFLSLYVKYCVLHPPSPHFNPCSVDAAHGKVDLSLRLSHVNPEAAKKLRKKQERIKAQKEKDEKKTRKRKKALTSDGESNELESVESRYFPLRIICCVFEKQYHFSECGKKKL